MLTLDLKAGTETLLQNIVKTVLNTFRTVIRSKAKLRVQLALYHLEGQKIDFLTRIFIP